MISANFVTGSILITLACIAIGIVIYVKCKEISKKEEKKYKRYQRDRKEIEYRAQPVKPIAEPVKEAPKYEAKSIMTEAEKKFFETLKKSVPNTYIVQPQINLATVVNKTIATKYQNELYRNIDFGIFDESYNLKVLIELNDKSHEEKNRIERDKKVKEICAAANIPLIAFWLKYPNYDDYVSKHLSKYF